MSRVSVELQSISRPEAIATAVSSIRRPSTIGAASSELNRDDASLQNLERVVTAVESKTQTAAVISAVTLITGISTLLNGLTTVVLPTMAADLGIPDNLLLWYV